MAHTTQGDLLATRRTDIGLAALVPEWQASVDYETGDLVRVGTLLYVRISAGTSGLTFDAAEEANWNSFATSTIPDWTASYDYVEGDPVVEPTQKRILVDPTAHTSEASYNTTEQANWADVGHGVTTSQTVTGSQGANPNEVIFVDTAGAGGGVLITLPTVSQNVRVGDVVYVIDISGDADTKNINVSPEGDLNGSGVALTLDQPYQIEGFVCIGNSGQADWASFGSNAMRGASETERGYAGWAPKPSAGEEFSTLMGSGTYFEQGNALQVTFAVNAAASGGNVPFDTVATSAGTHGIVYSGSNGTWTLPEGVWLVETGISLESSGVIADLDIHDGVSTVGAGGAIDSDNSTFSSSQPTAIVFVPASSTKNVRCQQSGASGSPTYKSRSWMMFTQLSGPVS